MPSSEATFTLSEKRQLPTHRFWSEKKKEKCSALNEVEIGKEGKGLVCTKFAATTIFSFLMILSTVESGPGRFLECLENIVNRTINRNDIC